MGRDERQEGCVREMEKEVEAVLKSAWSRKVGELGLDDPSVAAASLEIATAYAFHARYKEATIFYDMSLFPPDGLPGAHVAAARFGMGRAHVAAARFGMGRLAALQGHLDEAVASFEKSIEAGGDALAANAGTLAALAQVFRRKGDLSRALDLYSRGLDLPEKDTTPAIRAKMLHHMIQVLCEQGDHARAQEIMDRCLEAEEQAAASQTKKLMDRCLEAEEQAAASQVASPQMAQLAATMRRMKLLFRKQQAVSNERLRLSGAI
ncbi:hypothetical protein T484DRAFT_1829456 [Baffinella frigidus]|nr:hypothetical protein T484DRAFT_1829456 [Cryptophyta sp. CCMP2293]